MLDLRAVASAPDAVVERLRTRGGALDLGPFQALIEERRALDVSLESLHLRRNAANEAMKQVAKAAPQEVETSRAQMREVSQTIKEQEKRRGLVQEELERILLDIPNLPDPSVPVGQGPEDNVEIRRWGQAPRFLFTPKQHFELGEGLGMLDFERAAKVSGARFVFYRGALARLERALVAFMVDVATERGYTELLPPYLVLRSALQATGQLPKFEQDLFRVSGEPERFLIPTAEVPVTNYHADEILDGEQLPLRYVAFSPCFRAEAGAAGRDTRGLIRHHQFHKVELVNFVRPEDSMPALEAWWTAPPRCCGGSGSTTGWCSCALGTWASAPPKRMTSRCGSRGKTPSGRFPPAPTAATSRRAGQKFAFAPSREASRSCCTPSMARPSPWAGRWWRSWRMASARTGRWRCPRCFGPTSGA